MTIEERFEKAAILVERLEYLQKTGTLRFTDMDEKLSLQTKGSKKARPIKSNSF